MTTVDEATDGTTGVFVVRTVLVDNDALLQLSGELDAFTEHHLRAALDRLARQSIRHFTIDASDLSFVGASGVSLVVDLFSSQPDSVVTLVGASPTYLRMLEVTGVDAHLAPIH